MRKHPPMIAFYFVSKTIDFVPIYIFPIQFTLLRICHKALSPFILLFQTFVK